MDDWTINKALETYNIAHWSDGYFDINPEGHVVMRVPHWQKNASIDLFQLSTTIRQKGLSLPVLVRFSDILQDRVNHLYRVFNQAMQAVEYQGNYTAVYPIKVNQQRRVVEEILKSTAGDVGLEAGSKPELMAVIALSSKNNSVIVCNGYKDREYIRLALIGSSLGLQVYIVIEKLSELALVIHESQAMGIEPLIGVRVRLASIGAGKWQNTGGEKSKFGLSTNQVLEVIKSLRKATMLNSLQLLHCHMGSQITTIKDIQGGMRECARYYAELHKMNARIRLIDVGGGLGVDYEGTRSRSFCSMDYSMQEYANNVVQPLCKICDEHNLPHPGIMTESGRAITAHHAVLITNVIDSEGFPDQARSTISKVNEHQIITDLRECLADITQDTPSSRPIIKAYHDAARWISKAYSMYNHGTLDLEQRAKVEELYAAICWQVRDSLRADVGSHRELIERLNEKLADKYFCNFSIFQSLPDVWAIEQIFPVVPLHRLHECPTRRAVLEDITCDSDGRIDHYVDGAGIESSLPLHGLRPDEDYLLGIFLVGAYQEILGDMHNLFGDTDSVHVIMEQNGNYHLVEPQKGDTADSVLRYVHYDPEVLLHRYEEKITNAVLTDEQRKGFLNELKAGIGGYTYFED